jgi:hypothetical protein
MWCVVAVRLLAWSAVALLLALGCSSAAAQERVPVKAWPRVRVYDMAELKKANPRLREFVGVRFNYRHETIRLLRPTWHQGSIWSMGGGEFDYIPVMVADKDIDDFRRFPSNFKSSGSFVVYGQVLRDTEANWMFLRLAGTKVTTRGGQRVVSW